MKVKLKKDKKAIGDWELIVKEAVCIDDFYNATNVSDNYPKVSDLLDKYCNATGTSMLSIYDWSKLHIKMHNEVINYHTVYAENVELKAKYSELFSEVNSIKNTLVENHATIIYLNTFYS
ncbi:MAG: hypothetical protein Q7W45_05515 [Bacteroidota bacterium]|nr:hypothetical protein [Bacteroidota bacterium]MDP3144905.1 hypothetical protein [Bacteroidota bacterium]MDP3557082.1 hypothetical protein [Bacteroidota bacterium]